MLGLISVKDTMGKVKDPIFVRPAYEYDSYRDFWTLVELSKFSQRKIKYANLDEEETFIITPFGGEPRDHIRHRKSILDGPQKAKLIWWNLERPDANGEPLTSALIKKINDDAFQFVDEIWVSDGLLQILDPRSRFVPLGSHPGLGGSIRATPKYDLAHMSYLSGRRKMFYDRLSGFALAPTGWADERTKILSESRAMINVHQTDGAVVEPLRFAIAAAHGIPLFSETCTDLWPLRPDIELLSAPLESLPEMLKEWLARGDLESFGIRLKKRLCVEITFRQAISDAMEPTGFDQLEAIAKACENAPTGEPFLDELFERDRSSIYYRFLYRLMKAIRPRLSVELGAYRGWSTAHMAAAYPLGRVISVDINRKAPEKDGPFIDDVLKKYPNIEFFEAPTESAIVLDEVAEESVDLCFIDASHESTQVERELRVWLPKMKKGGILLFDDVDRIRDFWDGLKLSKKLLPDCHWTGFGAAVK